MSVLCQTMIRLNVHSAVVFEIFSKHQKTTKNNLELLSTPKMWLKSHKSVKITAFKLIFVNNNNNKKKTYLGKQVRQNKKVIINNQRGKPPPPSPPPPPPGSIWIELSNWLVEFLFALVKPQLVYYFSSCILLTFLQLKSDF